MTFREWQQLTPVQASRELVQRVRLRLRPGQQQAVIAVLRDETALARAFEASSGGALGRVPYFLKDLFDVRGMQTRAGSSFLAEVRPVPDADARIVAALAGAGAVLAGKTHMTEFAWGLTGENAHFGDCEHPAFPGRTSGGSSSGSAAVVAAGVAPFAIGTDTGGSVRVPAAYLGIFGYRSDPGSPFIADAVPLAPGFDAPGWFSADRGDMDTLIGVLAPDQEPVAAPVGCYLEMPGVDPEVAQALAAAAERLGPAADPATREELQARFAPAAEVYGVVVGTESWRTHRKWADKYRSRYGPLVRERIDLARAVSPAQVAAVGSSQAALLRAWEQHFTGSDFLAMPAAPFAAPQRSGFTAESRLRILSLTAPASLAGLPALTLPVPIPGGLSAGLQVVFRPARSSVARWALGRWTGF